MPALRLLWYYLWIAPHVLQVVILIAMVRRRLYERFRIFFLYTGFEVLQFAVLFGARHAITQEQFFLLLSLGLAVSTVLRFGVVYEVFLELCRAYPALNNLLGMLFRRTAIVLLLTATVLAAATPGSGIYRFRFVVSVFDSSFSIVQCGLLLFLFLFSRYFALSWRQHVFGIALGFGVYASFELASSALRSQISPGTYLFDYLSMATYHCCVLIWLFYILAPAPEPRLIVQGLPGHDLEDWSQELQRLLHQ
jgi:hypothetical protein